MLSIQVTAKSLSNIVAGDIANSIRLGETVQIEAIDAKASKQALKAIIVARGYLDPVGIDLVVIPSFSTVVLNGYEKTAIMLTVEKK